MPNATIRLVLATLVAVAGLSLGLPASAAPPPLEDRVVNTHIALSATQSREAPASMVFILEQYGAVVNNNTKVRASISSCGALLVTNESVLDGSRVGHFVNFSPDGTLPSGVNDVNRLVGPKIDYVLEITQPGFDPYTIEGTYANRTAAVNRCDKPLGDPIVVKRWSAKDNGAFAKVGKRSRITKTVTNADTVTYEWRVGKRVVGTGLTFKPKRSMAGKRLRVLVRVELDGRSDSHTLSYGAIRA